MEYLPELTVGELAFLGEQLGAQVRPTRRIIGGQSATTDVIDVGGREYVLRRHGHWSIGFDDDIAKREAVVMTAARMAGLPVPRVLWAGSLPTGTGIITEAVAGLPVIRPERPRQWTRQIAETLARISAVAVSPEMAAILDAAPPQSVDSETPPEFRFHPRGDELLERRRALRPTFDSRVLVHGDYWPGNLLWHGDAVTAVLDWEAAHLGDPVADLGYCYVEMHLLGLQDQARALRKAYADLTGDTLAFFRYWLITALCRAVPALETYLDGWRGIGVHEGIDDVQRRLDSLVDIALDDGDL